MDTICPCFPTLLLLLRPKEPFRQVIVMKLLPLLAIRAMVSEISSECRYRAIYLYQTLLRGFPCLEPS